MVLIGVKALVQRPGGVVEEVGITVCWIFNPVVSYTLVFALGQRWFLTPLWGVLVSLLHPDCLGVLEFFFLYLLSTPWCRVY